MTTTESSGARQPNDHVKLVYHYRDGHHFTTEPMLRAEAVAYMPVLHAVPIDAEHYEAPFAVIEMRAG